MKSITLHNLDNKTVEKVEQLARESGKSLNKTIKDLLNKALGLEPDLEHARRKEFDEFIGVWGKDDLKSFGEATHDFGEVNEDDWR